MISLMERPLRKWHVSVTLFAARLSPTQNDPPSVVHFTSSSLSLSYFLFFWILFPHFPSLRPSLALFSPSFCMVHSFLLHSSSHNFNVMALLQHPSLILLFSPSPSFPLSLSLSFSPCGAEKNTAFPLTKTLLLSGNYRRRLITTLGSNDAAPNEIFIKDPSASN